MKAVVAAFNQEKALVGAFFVITNLRMDLFEALLSILSLLGWERRLLSECGLSLQLQIAVGKNESARTRLKLEMENVKRKLFLLTNDT